jgi:hypothetical protein
MLSARPSEEVMLSIKNLFAGYPMFVAIRGERQDMHAWRSFSS